ncbi:unnamed protein product [Effrenium voratum]|nr:unnamed protein product [Effrenium voratum]
MGLNAVRVSAANGLYSFCSMAALGKVQFMTSQEAEYPSLLCKHTVDCILQELRRRGRHFEAGPNLLDSAIALANFKQPRGLQAPTLLSEFQYTVQVLVSAGERPPAVLTSPSGPWSQVPPGAVFIGAGPAEKRGDGCTMKGAKRSRDDEPGGPPTSRERFLQDALQLTHPFDNPLIVSEQNRCTINWLSSVSPADAAEWRLGQLRKYLRLAVELSSDEARLHEGLHPDLVPVLQGKRLLLFKAMMEDAGVADPYLFQHMVDGFPLVGHMEPSGQFPKRWKPARLTLESLKKTSHWARKAALSSCAKGAADQQIADAVWSETQDQLQRGWLKGPFTEADLDARNSGVWIPSRRFGVKQGVDKIRCVDDFSEFLLNEATATSEKLVLEGLDDIVALARFWLSVSESKGQPFPDLKGRCLDLKAAYKQLARSPEHAWASVIAVWSPAEKKTVFFESVALPFGAVSAVISFNRAARALRDILCKLFRIAATNFFDDFCTVEGEPLCQNCLTVSEMVMQLLGWKISMGDTKRFPFEKKFQILGAVMSFEGSTEGLVAVENKPDRISSIRRACEDCQKGGLTDADLASLKGKLLYAAGHTFGKATQLAVQLLGRQAARIKQDQQGVLQAVLEVVDVLAAARPRVLRPMGCEPPVIVFTDGACEQEGKLVTHGAVLCDPLHSVKEFFGGEIPEALVTEWASSGSRQLIGQAEIYPVVLAKATWAGYLAKRKVIWFIDNESARASFIRSFSPVLHSVKLLWANARLDVRLELWNWYARVPSKSNFSDAASRLDFGCYQGWKQVEPCYEGVFAGK